MPELPEHDGELVEGPVTRLYLWQSVSKANQRADEADALRAAALSAGLGRVHVRQIELLSETNRHLASNLALLAHTHWDQRPRTRPRTILGRILRRVLAWLEEV